MVFAAPVLFFVEFDVKFFAEVDYSLGDIVSYLEFLYKILFGGIRFQKLFAVGVDIFDYELVEYSLGHKVAVVWRVPGGVDGYEAVGHDAASAIDGAFVVQGLVLERIGQMD